MKGILSLANSVVRQRWRSILFINVFCKGRQIKHKFGDYNNTADPFERVHINPQDVSRYMHDGFSHPSSAGRVIGGDWDQENHPAIDTMPKHKAIHQVLNKGVEWSDTALIDHLMIAVERDGSIDGYTSRDELETEYVKKVEQLIESIRENGYQSVAKFETNPKNQLEEVCINIGRDGELIFNGGPGRHRISIARVLGVEKIPVIVLVRHERWQRVRERVARGDIPKDQS